MSWPEREAVKLCLDRNIFLRSWCNWNKQFRQYAIQTQRYGSVVPLLLLPFGLPRQALHSIRLLPHFRVCHCHQRKASHRLVVSYSSLTNCRTERRLHQLKPFSESFRSLSTTLKTHESASPAPPTSKHFQQLSRPLLQLRDPIKLQNI